MCLFCDSLKEDSVNSEQYPHTCLICFHWHCCEICGIVHTEPLETVEGQRVCANCLQHRYANCEKCGKLIFTDGYCGEWYCAECAHHCDHCNKMHDCMDINGDTVCVECIKSDYTTCDNCGCYVHYDNTISDDYISLCNTCYRDDYSTCYNCSQIFRIEDACISEDGYDYCEECYPEHTPDYGDPITSVRFERLKTNRWFGVELETSDGYYYEADDAWTEVSEHCGTEFVSPLLQGDSGLEFIEEFYNDVKPVMTDSCGLHVHIDIRDLDNQQRLMLIKGFKDNKKFFFDKVDPERHINTFCCNDIPDVSDSDTYDTYMNRVNSTCRYCWINLNAIHKHGSIEIRLHEATEDATVVTDWVVTLLNFVAGIVEPVAV